jgi:SAM-dependent methyltransferase
MSWQDPLLSAMMVKRKEGINMEHGLSKMIFPDFFSRNADVYVESRPTYPDEMFAYLASIVPGHNLSWDCATGNGQAALGLTPYFHSIVATDASPEQIAKAKLHPKVTYLVAPAEQTTLKDGSVDLVTVAHALHWFDLDRFYAEVRRVVRPGGILACWTYHQRKVSPVVDAVVQRLYDAILGPFWPPGARHSEDGYRFLPFPFEAITPPTFPFIQKWDMNRLAAYMSTWSGTERYRNKTGRDPIGEIRDELTKAWGDPDQEREIAWTLFLRVGRLGSVSRCR